MGVRLKGSANFRQRLVSATLAGKPLRIDDIRADSNPPGLRSYEVSLLRLLEKISNGCVVEINETGTKMRFQPGVIVGGSGVKHDCGTARAMGYFLEPLIVLGLFAKKPLTATLQGITNDDKDSSVDAFRAATLPLLNLFGVPLEEMELKIVRRGCPPLGGGEIKLGLPVVKALEPVSWTDEGLVKRIRGVAHSCRASPQMANRMVDAARGLFNRLLADVYIFTDHRSGAEGGSSPGYGMSLVAETTSGCFLTAEVAKAKARSQDEEGEEDEGAEDGGGEVVPEDLGLRAAQCLLEEIRRGGVMDSCHQAFAFLLCALGPEDVSSVRTGPLTPYAIQALRDIRAILGVTFNIETDSQTGTVFLSCIGCGMKNRHKSLSS